MPILTVTAPVADRSLVALSVVKSELGITGTDADRDAMLTRWIKELSDTVCETCGVAADEEERRTFLEEPVAITIPADEVPGGCSDPDCLILPWRPRLKINSLTVGGGAVAASGYRLDKPLLLWRLSSSRRIWWERDEIVITGTAGWALADMPAALSSAVTDAVRYRWFAHTRGDGDPLLRSYENVDVEKMTWMDGDKVEMVNGLPAAVVDRIGPYVNRVIG